MIKRPAASFIRTVALCWPPCLLPVRVRGRDESRSKGAEREKPCKSGCIQAAVSSCISANHRKNSKGWKERPTVSQTVSLVCNLVPLCFSDLFSLRDDAKTTELFSHLTKKKNTNRKDSIHIKKEALTIIAWLHNILSDRITQTQPLEWTRPRDGCQSVQARDASGAEMRFM